MELPVKDEELGHARPVLDSGLELTETVEIGLMKVGYRLDQRQRFESLAHLIEQVNVTAPEQRNSRTFVGLELCEPLRF
jgi:hypothetical protein